MDWILDHGIALPAPRYHQMQQKIPKNPEGFSKKILGSKFLVSPDPKNPGIPGFLQKKVPKILRLKLLIPLGPAQESVH